MSSDSGPLIDIDIAIRQLLDQQADIQARLASLFAAHHQHHHQHPHKNQHDGPRLDPDERPQGPLHPGHGLDLPRELDMLRHKRRVLEEMVDYHGLASRILPFPSDMEEARAIQYRCEYLETICLQEQLDVPETLRLSSQSAPPGFPSWLDKHLDLHDPVLLSRRERDKLRHTPLPRTTSRDRPLQKICAVQPPRPDHHPICLPSTYQPVQSTFETVFPIMLIRPRGPRP